jgi:hypothetical protein
LQTYTVQLWEIKSDQKIAAFGSSYTEYAFPLELPKAAIF